MKNLEVVKSVFALILVFASGLILSASLLFGNGGETLQRGADISKELAVTELLANKRKILERHNQLDRGPVNDNEFMFIGRSRSKTISQSEAAGLHGTSHVNDRNTKVMGVVMTTRNATNPKFTQLHKTPKVLKVTKALRIHHNNSTRASCIPKKSPSRMENLFGREKFNQSLPPFLTLKSDSLYTGAMDYYPPFGFKGSEKIAKTILKKLPLRGLPITISKLPCRRCVVVGNGGILLGSQLGEVIDKHDVVIRLNLAPTLGYERDVGHKTSMRLMYPESSRMTQSEYKAEWLLVVVPYKAADFAWAERLVDGRDASDLKYSFWENVAHTLPKEKKLIRIFNLEIIKELASDLIGFDMSASRKVPTMGPSAVALALRFCDEVSIVGFGYNKLKPDDSIHYYEKNSKMKVITRSSTHNVAPEHIFLQRLVEQGIIQDLTKGVL